MIATSVPPRAPGPRFSMLFAWVAAAICIIGLVRHARADEREIIGWRMEITACRGLVCGELPASKRVWGGRYACTGHAENIATFVDADLLKRARVPAGAEIRARCVAVMGMPSA